MSESTVKSLEDAAEVVLALSKIRGLPLGVLTSDEVTAVDAVGRVVGVARLITNQTDTPLDDAVVGVLSGVPALAELVIGMLTVMREIILSAETLDISLGNVGKGVEFEALP